LGAQCRLPCSYIRGMDVLIPAFCRTRRMTHNIERRRTSQPARGRPSPAAESHQTRPRCAPEAPCCARQAKVRKEGQLGRTAAQKPKGRQTKPAAGAREGSKAAKVLGLLRRPDGASLKELMRATGWLAHSVRGYLSGTVSKRMGLKLVSAKNEDGERRYSVQG
jgi:hypothetical protein